MENYCKSCGCEIPDNPINREPLDMKPEYCERCDPDAPDYDPGERD